MTQLEFSIRFHSPFAVATGVARDGMDTSIDHDNPLPSTAIKGLLKAQLLHLNVPEKTVASIFHHGEDSGWIFSDAEIHRSPDTGDGVNLWTRVKVSEGGRAEQRMLMVGEQAGADTGSFTITWDGAGAAPADQVRALRAAARCVTSLGSHRRRGLGWVSIVDTHDWTAEDTTRFQAWILKAGA